MNWDILGIEPTVEKAAITKAYRKQLAHTNPEDKPEEFKALREAYEEALAYAAEQQQSSEKPAPQTPLDKWLLEVEKLYGDFKRRIDPAAWEELLAQDVCLALDTRTAAENALLVFLLDHYFLPQGVWQAVDKRFSLVSRKHELYERFPAGFIDGIIVSGTINSGVLRYDLFEPGENAEVCDEYFRLYLQANQLPHDQALPLLEQMRELPEYHPYGEALEMLRRIEFREEAGERDLEALAVLENLAAKYSDDVHLTLVLADACSLTGHYHRSEELAQGVAEADEGNRTARWLWANALAKQERYDEGVERLNELMRSAGGDQKELYNLSQVRMAWNEFLITRYTEQLAEDANNNEALFNLAWCYLQNERDQESYEMCQLLDREQMDPYDYLNLISQAALSVGKNEEAFQYSKELLEVVRVMEPDGTDKTRKRLARFPEFVSRCGYCLLVQEKNEEAVRYYEEALSLAPDDSEMLTHMVGVMISLEEYEQAVHYAEHLTEAAPGMYHGHYMLARVLFEMHNDRDAFASVNRALELDGGDLGVYVLKARILLRNGAGEEARAIVDFLRENGVEDEPAIMWCEAVLAEFYEQDKPKALKLYEEACEKIEEGIELDWTSQFYYRRALLTTELAPQGESVHERVLELLDKGLTYDKKDLDCRDFRAWTLRKMGRREEAIQEYQGLVELPHEGCNLERALAELYSEDLVRNAEAALKCLRVVLEERAEDPYYLYYAGMAAYRLGLYEEAERYFMKEQEVESDCTDGFRMMTYVYMAQNRNEEALEQVNKCIEVGKRENALKPAHYDLKVRVLRRMGRPREAINTIDEAREAFDYFEANRDIFSVLVQFGLFDEARDYLRAWQKSHSFRKGVHDHSGLTKCLVELAACREDYLEAKRAYRSGHLFFTVPDRNEIEALLAFADGSFSNELRIARKRLEEKDLLIKAYEEQPVKSAKDKPDPSYELGTVARILFRQGNVEEAREYAARALEHVDESLKLASAATALHHTKRAYLIAILGNEEEALAELELARSMPLCEMCAYGACKDADLFEVFVDACFGREEEALQKTAQFKEKWPDENDFWCFAQYLKRKRAH